MSSDQVKLPEADLPRARPIDITATGGILSRLDATPWFRPTLIGVCAVTVGFVLAPQWARQSYPTEEALLHSPADGDIKAQYDDRGDIVDESTTERLREEAAAQTKRIYDLDVSLGENIASRVREAFDLARARLDALNADPRFGNPNMSRAVLGEYQKELAAAHKEAIGSIESELGITLGPAEAAQLAADGYSESTRDLLATLMVTVHRAPVVAARPTLLADADLGLVLRRVPDDGTAPTVVNDVHSVSDLGSVRNRLKSMLEALIEEQGTEAVPADVDRQRINVPVILTMARQLLQPNLTLNRKDTELARENARQSVAPVMITVKRGEMIIRDGEVFTKRHLLILRHMAEYGQGRSIVRVAIGATLLVLVLMLVGLALNSRGVGWDLLSRVPARDALFMACLFTAAIVVGRLWLTVASTLQEAYPSIPDNAFLYVLPIAAGAMVARLVLRFEAALIFSVVSSLVLG
ncbi:MAG: hypothetical protein R3C68_06425 [Myxococcota bacterium]